MHGLRFVKEPSGNDLFFIIAQLAKVLVNFVALKWCKNVVSETSPGKCHKQHSTLL